MRSASNSLRPLLLCALLLASLICRANGQQKAEPAARGHAQLRDEIKNRVRAAVNDDDDDTPDPPEKPEPAENPAAKPKEEPQQPPLAPLQAPPMGDRLDLHGVWQLHSGSNPAYASPTFDDHAWLQVDSSSLLIAHLLINLNEVWYRRHVHLAPGSKNLAITIADFGGSYRVIANGQVLGGHGKMADRGDDLSGGIDTYPIPDSLLNQPDLVIVIHAFVGTVDRISFTLGDGINRSSRIYLGPADILYRDQQTFLANGLTEGASTITLWIVLCLLALALALLIRTVPAYPLLAIYAAGHVISTLLTDYGRFHFMGGDSWLAWPINLTMMASELAALEFCRYVTGTRRKFWFTAIEVFYVLCYAALLPAVTGGLSYALYTVLSKTAYITLVTTGFLLILLGVRRRKQDAYILASFAAVYVVYFGLWEILRHITFDYYFLEELAQVLRDRLDPHALGDFAIVAGFLTVVVVRTLRAVRERALIATEIEAARTMQQLLLARSSEPTPGFAVETAYLPAGEVGGDFFLVSLTPDGALSAIVGDVSGKGMMAAMRVSMILGVLRREPSREPAIVLSALNEALVAQSDTGFTTACCVKLEPNGRYTVANAGHISPYVTVGARGLEIVAPPALPLGLAPGQYYDVLEGQLHPGQRMVLMSDGVPEARGPKGELYGFDRLPAITPLPAAEIAAIAKGFGQEDDITVLTLCALAAPTTNQPPPPAIPQRPAPPPPPPL
jgi:hypothetical protein